MGIELETKDRRVAKNLENRGSGTRDVNKKKVKKNYSINENRTHNLEHNKKKKIKKCEIRT